MNKKIIFVSMMFAIYIAGIISGGFIGRYIAMSRGFVSLQDPHKPPAHEHIVDMFAKKLDLTGEQKKQFSIILKNNKDTIDKYHNEFESKMKETMDTMNESMKTILSEKQKKALDELIKQGPGRHGPRFHSRRPYMHDMPPPDMQDKPPLPPR